jgi:hypothetical protein
MMHDTIRLKLTWVNRDREGDGQHRVGETLLNWLSLRRFGLDHAGNYLGINLSTGQSQRWIDHCSPS